MKTKKASTGIEITEFASGMKVATFRPVLAKFNPMKADEETLVKYGYPPRPVDNPQLMKKWMLMFGRRHRFVKPRFVRMSNMFHGPLLKKEIIERTLYSSNWSGAVIDAPSGKSFSSVVGEWTIPNPYAVAADDSWYYSGNWVGIDGTYPSDNICHAGIGCDAKKSGSTTSRNVYAWWEWYPDAKVKISSFTVSPGDTVYCVICKLTSGDASVYLANLNSGSLTSFYISPPSGTSLVGHCAEWIVEAPQVSGSTAKLADYGMVYFDTCVADYGSGTISGTMKSSEGNNINMKSGSRIISQGSLVGDSAVKCFFTS